jgi:hypothetical protein
VHHDAVVHVQAILDSEPHVRALLKSAAEQVGDERLSARREPQAGRCCVLLMAA